MPTDDPIARAFELARDGQCRNVSDIRRKLEREGYSGVDMHFRSASLKKQLAAAIKAQREAG
jgi:predicted alpha/beta-fold hydrolase